MTLDEQGLFKGGNYKCRGYFISSLGFSLVQAIEDLKINDPEFITRITDFANYKLNYYKKLRTSEKEIAMINQVLAKTIKYLEGNN